MERVGAPVCIYAPGERLSVWLDHPRASEARARVDGVPVELETYVLPEEPLGGGVRVPIPAESDELVVEVPDEDGSRTWGLLLLDRAKQTPVDSAELDERKVAFTNAGAGDDAAAIEETMAELARWSLAHDRRKEAAFAHAAAAFFLRKRRQFEAAERVLDRGERMADGVPVALHVLRGYRGVLYWSQGRYHEAATILRDVVRHSLRVESRMGLADSMHIYAEALVELGYYEAARRWAGQALEHANGPCNRASVLRTRGWTNLLLLARGQPHDDPVADLEAAIRIYREPNSECRGKEAGARLSLALLALENGRPEAARQLEAIVPSTLSPEDLVRLADLRVRVRRATAAPIDARWVAWRELEEAAETLDDDDGRWRVLTRRGEILGDEGRAGEAIEALEEAERGLDRLVRLQALVGVGRTATADRYLDSTVALVSLLADAGRPGDALCAARRARARRRSAVAGLDRLPEEDREALAAAVRRYREHKQRAEELLGSIPDLPLDREAGVRHEAAQLTREANRLVDEIVETLMSAAVSPSCAELSPAAPGELLVDLFPREHDWLVLAQLDGAAEVHVLPRADDTADAGHGVLTAIEPSLEAATRIRVLAHREAQALDVHRLPWKGRPLLASMPVAYGVELPARERATAGGAPQALLLGDPSQTLLNARAEIDAVRGRLRAAGWRTHEPSVDGGGAGLGERGFEGYALLHYAAHTEVDVGPAARAWPPHPGGVAAGEAYLQLGPTARLEATSIIARRPVPPVAFLAGCETGVVELDAGSTSIALAFLLADGQQVVASQERLDDATAVELAEQFYAAFVGPADQDAALAMHQVQQAWSEQGRGVVPYRVWVR